MLASLINLEYLLFSTPSFFTLSKMLLRMSKADKTDGSLNVFEQRKIKKVSDLNNSIDFNC